MKTIKIQARKLERFRYSHAYGCLAVSFSLVVRGLAQPIITNQPIDHENISVGSMVIFSVGVSGSTPITYQWRFNYVDLASAKNSTLVLRNVQTTNAGGYAVVVTDPTGSVTSRVARLTVDIFATPVPHYFSSIMLLPDKTATLSLNGSASKMFNLTGTISDQFMQMFDLYVVEASTNLVDWTRLDLLLRTNNSRNPLLFHDMNAADLNRRFYRTFTNHLITGFPKPTGPFVVGTFSRILTDASRSNRYGIKTNSSFMSTFWYPAKLPKAGSMPNPYTDRAVAGDQNWYNFWGWPLAWTNVVTRSITHAFPGTPLVSGTNRFPVILHSHGFTCDRTLNSYNAEELASHGYIVAAVDHEDCHVTVFPDERGVRYVPPSISNVKGTLFSSRTNDLVYLLHALEEIDASDTTLAGRMDLTSIGVMGHSMGGGTAAEICRSDSRVKCAALLDPFMFFKYNFNPDLNIQGLQKPFLSMNRTILDHSNILWDASGDSQRLYTLATHDATWLRIINTGHFVFSDWAWSVEMTSDSRRGAEAINACLVWFFDTYLKGEAPPFPTNPEIYNVQRK